jgi:diguanylate cyclase (GGDEF)-like protein
MKANNTNTVKNGKITLFFLKNPVLREFIPIFIPIFIIILSIFVFLYYNSKNHILINMEMSEKHLTEKMKDVAALRIKDIVDDTYIIGNLPFVKEFLAGQSLPESDIAQLKKSIVLFSGIKNSYEQIRLIGLNGMEKIRVQLIDNHPVVLPDSQLQFKGDRYYYSNTAHLPKNHVYLSMLDLNIENKMIEIPYNPMLRTGIPVYTGDNILAGIVVINYRAKELLDLIGMEKERAKDTLGKILFLNKNGYWIIGPSLDLEWGFMFFDKTNNTIGNLFPAEWKRIQEEINGQFYTPNGLFSFSTISHLEILGDNVKSENGLWIVLSWVSPELLSRIFGPLRLLYIVLTAVSILILGLVSYRLAVIANDRKLIRRELEIAAVTDPLTGLYNRRAFIDKANMELARVRRYKSQFSIVLADIDHFKTINDSFGHLTGDEVLRKVSTAIQGGLRRTDVVCRWGGEEFFVLLPDANLRSANRFANRLRQYLRELDIRHNGQRLKVTMSYGIAYCDGSKDLDECTRIADEGLYFAKSMGRDQVRSIQAPKNGDKPGGKKRNGDNGDKKE